MKQKIEGGKKCNENWHIFLDKDKPCQCGKIKNFTEYVLSMAKKKK